MLDIMDFVLEYTIHFTVSWDIHFSRIVRYLSYQIRVKVFFLTKFSFCSDLYHDKGNNKIIEQINHNPYSYKSTSYKHNRKKSNELQSELGCSETTLT